MNIKRKNISVIISFAIALIVLAALIVFAAILPRLVSSYIDLRERNDYFTELGRLQVNIILYVILIPAFIADISLLILLNLVGKKKIFTALSVNLLRLISLCCFAEVILFLILSKFFLLSLVVAFAALFLGIVLRVVKNVIEEAAAIKAENDFTV
ncbi:MAG: DUF2975 domain-containing protein [Clostridia bacterium]|nr:DUF2975 domain-containing protein [Clostridia bacterium]